MFSIFSSLFFVGCDNKDITNAGGIDNDMPYEKPLILRPENRFSFYAGEQIQISWQLPDTTVRSTEFHGLWLPRLFESEDIQYFESNTATTKFTDTFDFFVKLDEDITSTFYYGYRLRSTGAKGSSEWTDVKSFAIRPISGFQIMPLTFSFYFDFSTMENNNFYSGIAVSDSSNFLSAFSATNFNLDQIKVIRPISGNITSLDTNAVFHDAFDRLVIGYDDFDNIWTFDVIGETYPTTSSANFRFYPDEGRARNIRYLILDDQYELKMAYFLASQQYLNQNYKLKLDIEVNIYVDTSS